MNSSLRNSITDVENAINEVNSELDYLINDFEEYCQDKAIDLKLVIDDLESACEKYDLDEIYYNIDRLKDLYEQLDKIE